MKRRALQIIVLLSLGAIVNVAVAWGCVLRKDSMTQLALPNPSRIAWIQSTGEQVSQTFPPTEYQSLGCHIFFAHLLDLDFEAAEAKRFNEFLSSGNGSFLGRTPRFEAHHQSAGWPLLSVSGYHIRHTIDWRPTGRSGRNRIESTFLVLPYMTSAVPATPLWPGFAINTIFYTAILWMMFALPFVLRRRRRIKRGLCPACAYPIGTSPLCTECGTAVS